MSGPASHHGEQHDPGWVAPGGAPPPAPGPPASAASAGNHDPSGWGPPAPRPWEPAGWSPPVGGGARTGALPLHPMTVSDILDGAFKLLKADARTIVTIAAVFVVPIQLLAAFSERGVLGGGVLDVLNDPSTARVAADEGQSGADLALSLGATLANLLVLPFVAGAIAVVVASRYHGHEPSAGEALRRMGRRWWALLASWLVTHLLYVPALAACVLPALFLMPMFLLVAPALVVEELGPMRGIARSWRLVRRRYWPVLAIAVLSGLVASILGQVLAVLPTMVAAAVGFEWGWLLLAAGSVVSSLVTTPVVALVTTLVYFDARIRTEGFDLELIAADLARAEGDR